MDKYIDVMYTWTATIIITHLLPVPILAWFSEAEAEAEEEEEEEEEEVAEEEAAAPPGPPVTAPQPLKTADSLP